MLAWVPGPFEIMCVMYVPIGIGFVLGVIAFFMVMGLKKEVRRLANLLSASKALRPDEP
ncbi:MAG: hypothetical protein QF662_01125 [Phycisphaerae bacterium]|jgi:hypothetical protein|nr:hypothetical protein [Phycisphaerae bacterium]